MQWGTKNSRNTIQTKCGNENSSKQGNSDLNLLAWPTET